MTSKKEAKYILIIDDDDTIAETLVLILRESGYVVERLASGHNLNETLRDKLPDLILIDYLMPGENGAEITRKLRADAKSETIPIIMLAATSMYAKAGYQAGISAFLTKPFELDRLLTLIQKYLNPI